ncbi:hypothetical protein ACFFQF_28315 [Haladaptatus pallidirubidus]|uniref:Uncharacterized protein n=1 Tax=Haladaptatus pallidirubidus TaxID=1008152 RepID=A0AAV3UJD6_9EURY|nr:hypothetical protein [Haladaptatus pallidirubidus]
MLDSVSPDANRLTEARTSRKTHPVVRLLPGTNESEAGYLRVRSMMGAETASTAEGTRGVCALISEQRLAGYATFE